MTEQIQNSAYETNCDPATGLCTATLKVSRRGAYPIPPERISPILAERLKSAAHDAKTDGPEYLGFGYTLSIKDIDEPKRRIPFVASTPIVDRYGDIIEQDGWDLSFYRKNPVCLWGHDSRALPIARSVNCSVVDGKLVNVMEFASADVYDFADRVFRMVLGGFISTVSVGFIPYAFEWIMADPDPETGYQRITGRRYTKSELLETSVVNVPANPECLVVGRGFEKALAAFEQDDSVTTVPRIADSQVNRAAREQVFSEPCEAAYFSVHSKQGLQRHGSVNPTDTKEVDADPFIVAFSSGGMRALRSSNEISAEDAAFGMLQYSSEGFLGELVGADDEGHPVYRAVLRISKSGADENETIERAEKSGKKTQTVIFSKKYWTEARAKKWVSAHSLKTSSPEHTDTQFRYRQFPPSECKGGTYETLTQNFPKGLSLGVCNKKEKSAESTERKNSMGCTCGNSNSAAENNGAAAASGAVEKWDAGKEMGSTDKPEDWRKMSTIVLNDGKNKGDFKLPHHKGPGGKFATVRRGVANALARANQVKGASAADKAGARKHLTKHMAEFHKDSGKGWEFTELRFLENLRTLDAFVDALPEDVREAAYRAYADAILADFETDFAHTASFYGRSKNAASKAAYIEDCAQTLREGAVERTFNDAKLQKKMAKVHKFLNASRDYMEEMYKDVSDSMGQACDLADDVNGAFPPSKDAEGVQRQEENEPAASSIGDSTVADKIRAMHGHAKSARRSAYRSFGLFRESVLGAIENLEDLVEAMGDEDDPMMDDQDDPDDDNSDPSGAQSANSDAEDAADDGKAFEGALAAEATKLLGEASKEVAGAPPAVAGPDGGQKAATEASSVDDEVARLLQLATEGMRQEASS